MYTAVGPQVQHETKYNYSKTLLTFLPFFPEVFIYEFKSLERTS